MSKFYVRASNQAHPQGPFDIPEIAHHIQQGWLPSAATLAEPGTTHWFPLSQVPELAMALGNAGVASRQVKIPSGKLSCAKCGNIADGGRGCWIIGLVVILFPIGLLFLLVRPTWKCRSCGHTFKT